ncbi:MAG: M23 family metallopeptidase [Oscillospiraceae bacterium]|nr:M23 family metallopeptidase [Oscillospiraceae bacterium]
MIFDGKNRVTQPYGSGHGGIDIVGDNSRNVHAVSAGTVDLVQFWDGKTKVGSQSYGNLVRIKSGNTYFYYAHLDKICTVKGQVVKAGDIIGTMGSTGNSTGPHTHFEVRKGGKTCGCRVNPAPFCGVQNKKGTYIAKTSTESNAEAVCKPSAENYTAGTKVALNGADLFVSSSAKKAAKKISGNYYIYDSNVINGRLRITNSADKVGKKPIGKYVTGWVDVKDV